MRDGSWFGGWGHGSPGDPDPDDVLPVFDALLVPDVAEAMLDGESRGASLPVELRPLEEAIAALRASPSAAEFRGEARAMAAFRALHGRNGTEINGAALANAGAAHTLPLEIPHGGAGRRSRRARHRTPAGARPSPGPSLGRRVAQASAAAAALVVVLGITAYSGYLPGPLQDAAHRAIGAPSARTTPSGRSAGLTGGPGNLNGSATPATSETPSWTGMTPTGQPRTIAQVCEAYYADRQGDQSDYRKLSKAAGGPEHVQAYCQVHIRRGHGKPGHGSNGNSQDGNSQGNGNGSSGSNSGQGNDSSGGSSGQSNSSGGGSSGQSNGSSGGSSGQGK